MLVVRFPLTESNIIVSQKKIKKQLCIGAAGVRIWARRLPIPYSDAKPVRERLRASQRLRANAAKMQGGARATAASVSTR